MKREDRPDIVAPVFHPKLEVFKDETLNINYNGERPTSCAYILVNHVDQYYMLVSALIIDHNVYLKQDTSRTLDHSAR